MSRNDRFLAPDELAGRYDDVLRRTETAELAPEEWERARSRAAESAWGVGGFVTNGEAVLLIRQGRRWGESEPWVAPGGMLEADETHVEGAIREIGEETGLEVEIDGLTAINEDVLVNADDNRRFEFFFAMFDATPTTTELAADPGLDDEDIYAIEWFESLPENTYAGDLYARLHNRDTE